MNVVVSKLRWLHHYFASRGATAPRAYIRRARFTLWAGIGLGAVFGANALLEDRTGDRIMAAAVALVAFAISLQMRSILWGHRHRDTFVPNPAGRWRERGYTWVTDVIALAMCALLLVLSGPPVERGEGAIAVFIAIDTALRARWIVWPPHGRDARDAANASPWDRPRSRWFNLVFVLLGGATLVYFSQSL